MRKSMCSFVLLFAFMAVPASVLHAATNVPIPKPRPSQLELERSAEQSAKQAGLPEAERVCRSRLNRLNVGFKPIKPIRGKGGCGIAHPISVDRLPGGIALSGKTALECSTAEALAQWTSQAAAPAARSIYGSKLVRIDQFASYVCRPRNSKKGAKLSEHGRGRAIDLGRFILADGRTIEVGFPKKGEARRKKFLNELRTAGCTFFRTVLGPGSDGHHKDHFHFDVAQRKGGYRYCR